MPVAARAPLRYLSPLDPPRTLVLGRKHGKGSDKFILGKYEVLLS